MRIIALTLLTTGTLLAADHVKDRASEDKKDKLWAAISVNKPVLDRDTWTLDRFMMHFGLVNDGDEAVKPEAEESHLVVNGKAVKDAKWVLSIHNGPRDGRWKNLMPGEHLLTAAQIAQL